jgi:hypothetical protein
MWHVLNTLKSPQVGILGQRRNPMRLRTNYLAMDESKFVVLNKEMDATISFG